MKTFKTMKLFGVVAAIAVAGSVCMADSYRGDYRRDHHGGGRSYHGHYDGGRHCGYYRNSRGDLIFGLMGIGMAAAIVSTFDRPTVYVQPAPVVYRESQVIYVPQTQVIQQPVAPQQPVQIEPPPPMTVTLNIQNSNGSFIPVTLRQVGSQWVGPKGEFYDGVPTVGQLRPVYGF